VRANGGVRRVVVGALTTGALVTLLTSGAATATTSPIPPPVLARLPAAAALPSPAAVAQALSGPLSAYGTGGAPHVSVIDVATGRVLLDRAAGQVAVPASTTKLVTAAAALTVLGPQTRFTTRVLRSGSDLYLVGGGDPLLASTASAVYPTPADLPTLARAVANAVGRTPVRNVYAVGSAYTGPDVAPGWSDAYLVDGEVARVRSLLVDEGKLTPSLAQGARDPDPVLAAGTAFRSALARAGVAGASGASVTVAGRAPVGAASVASVVSPPVSALVERMLDFSDADIAEGLGRQVAIRSGQPATFAGTTRALEAAMARLGVPITAPAAVADASGLSRSDALSPSWLTGLLRVAATSSDPRLRLLPTMLPVAGFSGTLTLRFTGADAGAAGLVRAKTGWLNNASALAGYVTTRDGRLLAFAGLLPAPDRSSGEAALDDLGAALAACGCPAK
jgi:serine-type D-Ala-D-Ala carboxypeptidase/endopeptidase (penicillin-binding protein 4)